MDVILLERVAKLGQMGDTVRVRDGYARNFLLARGKALRATENNKKHFETQRAQIEARNLEAKKEADAVAEKLNGQSFTSFARRARAASSMARSPRAISPRRPPPAASRSIAIRSSWCTRSRQSACIRCPCICIRKST